ncbi:MAG: DHA2 family efflux MFS transporter permease subunit [Actinobacteria bacterium]|nr:DHA2 family efflux MFS transporter permease subunit [Actinomycetota bacterium]MDQ3532555.1 DHA2 family efflux MFS transporter permease subunit [Actinomycetota bacterium]
MRTHALMDQDVIHRRRWWTLSVLCLSLVMIIVGNTVLNVALPTLVRELQATSTDLQWMVDAYALVFAGLLLTCGALGDRFGRKGALVVGLVIFGVASALSTLANSPAHLIFARAVMGAGAALVMPATLSILTNVFPPRERGRAIAIWAGLSGAGAAIGPVAGGWLLEHFWWGSVFLLNVPIVIVALLSGRWLVPTSRDPSEAPLDPVGATLSIIGLGVLLYGIIEAPTHGWSSGTTIGAFIAASAVLFAFALGELRTKHPMLDLRYFQDRRFSTASGAITLIFFAMFGTFFLLTQYLQTVQGHSPFEAGLLTLPMALTLMLIAPQSARVVERFGVKRVVAIGLAVVALGLIILSTIGVDSGYGVLALSLVILATGMSLSMPPATTAIMASLPLGKAGVGSAVNDTTRELGGALGVAVLGSILASQFTASLSGAVQSLPAPLAGAATGSLGGALQVAGRVGGAPGAELAAAAKVAFVDAMGVALLVGASIALLASIIVARLMPVDALGMEPVTLGDGEADRLSEAASA